MHFGNFENCISIEKVVIGTTGFSNKEEKINKNIQRKIPILKAGKYEYRG